MCCGWHSTTKGTMLWQLCLASVKPAGIIQVFLEKSKTIPENSTKFKTEVILLKYATKLTIRLPSYQVSTIDSTKTKL